MSSNSFAPLSVVSACSRSLQTECISRFFSPYHRSPGDVWSRVTFLPTTDKHDPLGPARALNEFFILRAFHSIRS